MYIYKHLVTQLFLINRFSQQNRKINFNSTVALYLMEDGKTGDVINMSYQHKYGVQNRKNEKFAQEN